MHYYQFNIGDYDSHTKHLDLFEDLAYRRLLDLYYLHERPLNASLASVARQINMREHEDKIKIVLEEFFELTEEGWVNARADKEINHFRSKIEQASRAGKASAERRFNARSTDVQLNNKQEPITKKQRKLLPKIEQTLDQYLADCKEAGKKPVPEDHPIRAYAEDAGIDMDMLAINWLVFKDRHLGTPKLYKDWPGAFANSVKSRWYNIWFSDGEEMKWTSTGLQEKKVYDSRMKEANHG
jgi:uncharacterized protein YdaU (DUF1376 family)